MSEQPQEHEPFFRLNVEVEGETYEVIAHRDNTELWRHLGSLGLSHYDNSYTRFMLNDEERCARIWRHDSSYTQVEALMIANDYVHHDNLRRVNQGDLDAMDNLIKSKTGDLDQIPDDWAL